MSMNSCALLQSAAEALMERENLLSQARAAEKEGDHSLASAFRAEADLSDHFAEWMMRESALSFWSDLDGGRAIDCAQQERGE